MHWVQPSAVCRQPHRVQEFAQEHVVGKVRNSSCRRSSFMSPEDTRIFPALLARWLLSRGAVVERTITRVPKHIG